MFRFHYSSRDSEGSRITSASPTLEDGYGKSSPSSATTLLPRWRKGGVVPLCGGGFHPHFDLRFVAPRRLSCIHLRLLCLILHPTLVAIHLVLVGIWAKELEHRFTYPLEHQKIVTFLITAISTTFGVTLSIRRGLRTDQTLTATHDSAAAWSGMGSAVFQLWNQKALPASLVGVLSAFLYLGNILALHITAPALFSSETFNSSRSVPVGTNSLPGYDWSRYNLSSDDDQGHALGSLSDYALDALFAFPATVGTVGTKTNLGLSGGTLYDVLDLNPGTGNATDNATGFNITCGYMTDHLDINYSPNLNYTWLDNIWHTSWKGANTSYPIFSTQPGVIISPPGASFPQDYIFIYSTIPIIDSTGNRGSWMNITPPMHSGVSSFQPSLEPGTFGTTGNLLIDAWAVLYDFIPSSPLSLDLDLDDITSVSQAELSFPPDDGYKILDPTVELLPPDFKRPHNVTLHELENALSEIVASMFWTIDNIRLTHGPLATQEDADGNLTAFGIKEVENPPFLLRGNATLSIIAISAGLAASVALMLLSLQFELSRGSGAGEEDAPIDGTGILHTIWLCRSHPELETLLRQVEHQPTRICERQGWSALVLWGHGRTGQACRQGKV
ncbi:hypothetical protein DFH09DRAFT_1101011 [Mycena vulgaris]|nr:hypothetical protein DFH09DRAFT_1101011 [Mycena vulgaris]